MKEFSKKGEPQPAARLNRLLTVTSHRLTRLLTVTLPLDPIAECDRPPFDPIANGDPPFEPIANGHATV
jgi:hypothetical protein